MGEVIKPLPLEPIERWISQARCTKNKRLTRSSISPIALVTMFYNVLRSSWVNCFTIYLPPVVMLSGETFFYNYLLTLLSSWLCLLVWPCEFCVYIFTILFKHFLIRFTTCSWLITQWGVTEILHHAIVAMWGGKKIYYLLTIILNTANSQFLHRSGRFSGSI